MDSPLVLDTVQECIKDTIIPSWVSRPPPNVGLPQAGTLKADNWRIISTIHLPLSLLSLWQEGSPLTTPDACSMRPVLETSMHLICASKLITKRTISHEQLQHARRLYRQHIEGLKKNFPGFMLPTHHMFWHIFDSIRSFSAVRNFWCYGGERFIGRLRRIPINHISGAFYSSYCRSLY